MYIDKCLKVIGQAEGVIHKTYAILNFINGGIWFKKCWKIIVRLYIAVVWITNRGKHPVLIFTH